MPVGRNQHAFVGFEIIEARNRQCHCCGSNNVAATTIEEVGNAG